MLARVVVALAAVAPAAAPAAPIEAAEVLAEVAGDTPGWQATFNLHADADDVVRLVADADGDARALFSGIKSIRPLSPKGADVRRFEFTVDGGMSELKYVTETTLSRGKDGGGRLSWHKVSGDFDVVDGSWTVTPLATPGWCHVVYVSRVAMGPGFLQGLVRGGMRDAIVGIAARLKTAVARAPKKKTDPPAASEKQGAPQTP